VGGATESTCVRSRRDVTLDHTGTRLLQTQVIRNVIDEGVLAERVGVDVFAVGEHHRDDFAISAPELVLAAIASRTERIRLGTAVTVLSSDDPVRVFEKFATLDAIARGRAEITLWARLLHGVVPALWLRPR